MPYSNHSLVSQSWHCLTVTPYDDILFSASLTSHHNLSLSMARLPQILGPPDSQPIFMYLMFSTSESLSYGNTSSYGQTSSEYLVYSTTRRRVLEDSRKTLPYLPDLTPIRARDSWEREWNQWLKKLVFKVKWGNRGDDLSDEHEVCDFLTMNDHWLLYYFFHMLFVVDLYFPRSRFYQ